MLPWLQWGRRSGQLDWEAFSWSSGLRSTEWSENCLPRCRFQVFRGGEGTWIWTRIISILVIRTNNIRRSTGMERQLGSDNWSGDCQGNAHTIWKVLSKVNRGKRPEHGCHVLSLLRQLQSDKSEATTCDRYRLPYPGFKPFTRKSFQFLDFQRLASLNYVQLR